MKIWLQNILFGIIFTAILLFTGLRKSSHAAASTKNAAVSISLIGNR